MTILARSILFLLLLSTGGLHLTNCKAQTLVNQEAILTTEDIQTIKRKINLVNDNSSDARRFLELMMEQEWNYVRPQSGALSFIGTFSEAPDEQSVTLVNSAGDFKTVQLKVLSRSARNSVKEIKELSHKLIKRMSSVITQPELPFPNELNPANSNQIVIVSAFSTSSQGKTYQFRDGQILDVDHFESESAWVVEPNSNDIVRIDHRFFRPYIAPPINGLPAPTLGIDAQPTVQTPLPGSPPKGLRVRNVFPRSLAEAMGIQRFDIILAVNEQPVEDMNDYEMAAPIRGDGHLTLDIRRLARTIRFDTRNVVNFNPSGPGFPTQSPPLTVPSSVQNASLSIRGIMNQSGLFQLTFVGRGIGKQMGLAKGDKIFKVNNVEIFGLTDLKEVERLSSGRFEVEGEDFNGNSFLKRNY